VWVCAVRLPSLHPPPRTHRAAPTARLGRPPTSHPNHPTVPTANRQGGEAEVYDLLNALEDRMSHVNSAVVMATIKTFLHLTLSMTATHQQASSLGCSR
jgi:hypothetical protein